MMESHLTKIKDIIANGMDDVDMDVKLSALEATVGLISFTRMPQYQQMFTSLIPSMCKILELTIQNSKLAFRAFEIMIMWADEAQFFHPYMNATLQIFFSVCNDENKASLHSMAAEFLISLASSDSSLMSKTPNYLSSMVEMLLNQMIKVGDLSLELWNGNDDDIIPSASEIFEDHLNNFSLAIGGKKLIPIILPHLIQMINHQKDWRMRYAGLLSCSIIAEGCKNALIPHLYDLVCLILERFQDEEPRVRWAALTAIGQFSTDFEPKFQQKFHHLVVSPMASLYKDVYTKIQTHVSKCIISFCEHAKAEHITPYLDDLLRQIFPLLSSTDLNVLEESVACIGALGVAAKKYFVPYYETFMPVLKTLLSQCDRSERENLKYSIIEAMSYIGKGVGKTIFSPDATELMLAFQNLNLPHFGSEHSLRENLLQTAARVCQVLEQDFVPYLPLVVPILLETANMSESEYSELMDDQGSEREGWNYVFLEDQKIGIHTSALEEKLIAIQVITSIIETLQDACINYIDEFTKLLSSLVAFPYHQNIRKTCAVSFSSILNSIKSYTEKFNVSWQHFNTIFNHLSSTMIDAIKEESDQEVLVILLDSLAEIIEILHPDTLQPQICEAVFELLISQIEEMKEKAQIRMQSYKIGYYTQEEDDLWQEEEEYDNLLCVALSDLFGVMAKSHTNVIKPFLENKLNLILKWLPLEENSPQVRATSLFIIDDSILHIKESIQSIFNDFFPFTIVYTKDPNPAVRQSACFGIGVSAQNLPLLFSNWISESLDHLKIVIESQSDPEDEKTTTDHAISAFGKILLYQSIEPQQLSNLLTLWLSWLPLYSDTLEAQEAHQNLCLFLQKENPQIYGQNYQNLPKILYILSWCLSDEGFDFVKDETFEQIRIILKSMMFQGPEILKQALYILSPQERRLIIEQIDS